MSKNPTRRLTTMRADLQSFAQRLYDLLIERDWTQADLARKVWGKNRTDSKGYAQPVGKDRISNYINGKQLPDPATVKKLADAFGLTVEELWPASIVSAVERESPGISMSAVNGHFDKVLVQVRTILPIEIASQIMALISEAESARRAESR
jgi:transcriptional regulator with XRE-family HTH domain